MCIKLGARGGFLHPSKIKTQDYENEITTQGKTKLRFKYCEHQLIFNFKNARIYLIPASL
jgi:hypothetical protein